MLRVQYLAIMKNPNGNELDKLETEEMLMPEQLRNVPSSAVLFETPDTIMVQGMSGHLTTNIGSLFRLL